MSQPPMTMRCWSAFTALAALSSPVLVAAQMFEIPAEMLQGMMGGGMMGGGGGRGPKMTEWPKTENSEIEKEFEWLINTEWKGKTAKYLFLKDGIVESSLKECEREGMCLWAANNGQVSINTPTLKVVKFTIQGIEKADRKKLENKDEGELKRMQLQSVKAGKNGKKSGLEFSRVAVAEGGEVTTKDLYKVLDLAVDVEQGSIKSKFRKLSVTNHPDKGGDPQTFNEIRDAYEVLGDAEKRKQYDVGGMQLVKNIEMAWKEVDGQLAQMDAQLAQVPKNHPQYRQFKAQIDAQKKQFDKQSAKHDIEKKMRNDDIEVKVAISAHDLYNGVPSMEYQFPRLVICRGCRDDPTKAECQDCGRCPPEKIQIPKYANTPFGKQVVGMKEKEQESRDRCREVPVAIKGIKVPKGAENGVTLKSVADIGHQTPGKYPGRVILKVQRGSPEDIYTISESDLYTVLRISLEQALFGFEFAWQHLGAEKVTVALDRLTQPGQVVKLKKKGLVSGNQRGDLFVRIAVDLPVVEGQALTLNKPKGGVSKPKLEKEELVELREGSAYKRWREREDATTAGEGKKSDKKASDKKGKNDLRDALEL